LLVYNYRNLQVAIVLVLAVHEMSPSCQFTTIVSQDSLLVALISPWLRSSDSVYNYRIFA